jgi:large conductance mechanosensitive channel
MLREFRDFVARGNVLDLAVAVIIGAAFAKITTSLTDDVIMPLVGRIFGGLDFSSKFILLGPIPADYHDPMTYAALRAAGVPVLGWGQFVTVTINFLILAFIIFLLVRAANRMNAKPAEAPAEPAAEAADVALLREIRDELRKKG